MVLDVVCYRRHGHQEMDNPMFTQPEMYTAIRSHPPTLNLYGAQLAEAGVVSADEVGASHRNSGLEPNETSAPRIGASR